MCEGDQRERKEGRSELGDLLQWEERRREILGSLSTRPRWRNGQNHVNVVSPNSCRTWKQLDCRSSSGTQKTHTQRVRGNTVSRRPTNQLNEVASAMQGAMQGRASPASLCLCGRSPAPRNATKTDKIRTRYGPVQLQTAQRTSTLISRRTQRAKLIHHIRREGDSEIGLLRGRRRHELLAPRNG